MNEWKPIAILTILIVGMFYGRPALTAFFKRSNYVEEFRAAWSISDTKRPIDRLQASIGYEKYSRSFKYAIWAIASLFMIWSLGRHRAFEKDTFYVLKTDPELIVLQIYGDNWVCAEAGDDDEPITRRFTVLRSDDIEGKIFFEERKIAR